MADESQWSATRTAPDGFIASLEPIPTLESRGHGSGAAARHPDWPGPGPLDLRVHDLPHASSSIEWWYVNAHLTTDCGTPYSLFASFFRVDAEEEGAGGSAARTDPNRRRSHFVVWAITDVLGRAYHADSRLDPHAPADGLGRLDRGRGGQDPRIRRALREVFANGHVPLPDRLLQVEGIIDETGLRLDYGGNRFEKASDGSYRLEIADAARGLSARLTFAPEKPAIRHGADGVVCTDGDTEMFYYFVPRCRVGGSLQVGGEPLAVTGSGWYDHEFGTSPGEESGPAAAGQAWDWIALQLDDGTDVTVFAVVDAKDGNRVLEHRAIVIDASGERHELTEFAFEPRATWTSCSTFNAYPTRWRLELPAFGGALDVECAFAQQEFVTVLSPPGFWEGRVEATGTLGGRAVRGLGYVERSGYCDVESLDDFFSAVGRETRNAIDALIPAAPSAAQAERALGGERWRESLAGLDVDQYVRTVIAPIRHIVESGGKAWRSYGFLTCIDLAGGPVEEYRGWLALPELLHVGSLIVDDVEDQSDLRRGVAACHTLYGEALAINAGTACYFLAELVLSGTKLSADKRARGYALYFEAMRAAHAGQALDIDGQHHLLPSVVESGDAALLETRVLAVHRLKSAVPPAALARVAALLADAPAEVGAGLGALFEAYGVAFQIVDDVLNLRGFENGLKDRGEDIRAGKVTAPVARAFSLLGPADRRRLAEILTARAKDDGQVAEAIGLVDGCGALDACASEARDLVESAWQAIDAILPASQAKVRLRAFGWFILDRHY